MANHPKQSDIAHFQKLFAAGDSPEAKELAHALNTQKGGLGTWGPKTKAAFAAASKAAGIVPESVDFGNPKDPELLKLMGSLGGNSSERTTPVYHAATPKSLVTLLGKDLGEIGGLGSGEEFAERVIESAKKYHISLNEIAELKYADLDGDGKITKEEIGALISAAHQRRAGSEYKLYTNPNPNVDDGRIARDPNYDSKIRPEDLSAMLNPEVVKNAKDSHTAMQELLKEVDNPSPVDLTHGLKIHPSEFKTTEQLIDDYIKQRAELSGRSEIQIRRQLDRDGSGNISKDELLKDFNERAPRFVWHREKNGAAGVLINDNNVITNPNDPFASNGAIESLGGIMSQLSDRLGMGLDGKEYTHQRNGTWLPTGLGNDDSTHQTPPYSPHTEKIPKKPTAIDIDDIPKGGGCFGGLPKHEAERMGNVLKNYDLTITGCFDYKETSEHTRETVSNVRNALPASKTNGIV